MAGIPLYDTPYGLGVNSSGFGATPPGTAGAALVSKGASSAPAYGLVGDAGGGEPVCATRTVLAGIDATKNTVAWLSESGREGWFQWNGANLSAQVTADTQQGLYVAPASDPTGASGAWVRQYSGALNVCWFGAVADQTGFDSWPAFNGMLPLLPLLIQYEAFRYGVSIYVPAGQYEISQSWVITTPGVYVYGDGPRTSVIKAQATGTFGTQIIGHSPSTATVSMTGVGLSNIGIDCNQVNVSFGYLGETVYDGIVYNNVIINEPGAACVGFCLRVATISTAVDVCQSIQINSLLVAKYTVKGTVPAVLFDRCQEIVIIASKAWNGYSSDGSNYGTAAAWFIQDCKTVVMIGCSAASTAYAGVEVYANNRTLDGIHLIDPLFENLQTPVRVATSTPGTYVVEDFQVTNPRFEAPVTGEFTIDATVRAKIEVGPSTCAVGANASLTHVFADDMSQVIGIVGTGTTNAAHSIPNAVNAYAGIGEHVSIQPSAVPAFKTTDPTSGTTSILVSMDTGSTTELVQVLIGAPDSGGTGYRMLRVLNG